MGSSPVLGSLLTHILLAQETAATVFQPPEDVILDDTAKDEKVLARLGPGEYFGEMALLSNAPRNATVRAATELHTLTIHRDDFASLHGSIPALRKSIEETMERHRAAAPSETPQETK